MKCIGEEVHEPNIPPNYNMHKCNTCFYNRKIFTL